MKIRWIPSLLSLLSCGLTLPAVVVAATNSTEESQLVPQERDLQFQQRDLCRCQASWEIGGGRSVYYDYSNSFVHSNGYRVVEGVFVIDSSDPICRNRPVPIPQGAQRGTWKGTSDIFGNRRLTEPMANESVATFEALNESGIGDEEEEQRDLQTRYHFSSSDGGVRTRGGPRTRGTYRGYGTGTFQSKGGIVATPYRRPRTTQIGKGTPIVNVNDMCRNIGPGGIASCCFAGCRGPRRGLNQPSGTQCQTCQCNCPPIPTVFQCPFTPPPRPACALSVSVNCFRPAPVGTRGRGRGGVVGRRPCQSVNQVPFLQCACPGSCASTYDFKYTGKNCRSPAGTNIQNCRDFGGTMPFAVGIIGSVDGREFFYDANVIQGDVISLSDGRCIPNVISLTVVDRNNRDRVLQTIDVGTACDFRGVSLGDRFGAYEFTAYSCDDGTRQNCLRNMNFEVCTRNQSPGALSVNVQAAELELNGQLVDLSARSVSVLGANQDSCVIETRQVSICKRQDFTANAYVEGSSGPSTRCSDEAITSFAVQRPGLPPPVQIRQVPDDPPPRRPPPRSGGPYIVQAGKGGGGGVRARGGIRAYGGRGRGGIYQGKGGVGGRAFQGKGA